MHQRPTSGPHRPSRRHENPAQQPSRQHTVQRFFGAGNRTGPALTRGGADHPTRHAPGTGTPGTNGQPRTAPPNRPDQRRRGALVCPRRALCSPLPNPVRARGPGAGAVADTAVCWLCAHRTDGPTRCGRQDRDRLRSMTAAGPRQHRAIFKPPAPSAPPPLQSCPPPLWQMRGAGSRGRGLTQRTARQAQRPRLFQSHAWPVRRRRPPCRPGR